MESWHYPYLALPNMVSELMLDSISFSWLYCGSAMSEPIGRSSSQRKESELSQFHKPWFLAIGSDQPSHFVQFEEFITITLLGRSKPITLVRPSPMPVRIYPTQLAPQSAKQSEPSEQIGTVTDYFFVKSPHASSWFAWQLPSARYSTRHGKCAINETWRKLKSPLISTINLNF